VCHSTYILLKLALCDMPIMQLWTPDTRAWIASLRKIGDNVLKSLGIRLPSIVALSSA
jgi:hypothetical protein